MSLRPMPSNTHVLIFRYYKRNINVAISSGINARVIVTLTCSHCVTFDCLASLWLCSMVLLIHCYSFPLVQVTDPWTIKSFSSQRRQNTKHYPHRTLTNHQSTSSGVGAMLGACDQLPLDDRMLNGDFDLWSNQHRDQRCTTKSCP